VTPVDRTRPPTLGRSSPLRLPRPTTFHLANGIPVVLVERSDPPIASVRVLFRGGAGAHGAAQAGLAAFVADLLDEGTTARDAATIADTIELLGGGLELTAGWDALVAGVTVLPSRLPPALEVLADVICNPTFPPSEVARVRERRVRQIRQGRDDARSAAGELLAAALFGEKHPYGASVLGRTSTLSAFGMEGVSAFHRDFIHPRHATVLAVGAVDVATLRPLLERELGRWVPSGPGLELPPIPPPPPRLPSLTLLDRPGAAQSEIRVGGLGATRLTEDFFEILVLNTILGGSFTSRLNRNLREDKGYTYGAGSSIHLRRGVGPFLIGTGVDTEVTLPALVEILAEIDGLLREPVGEEELARARSTLALRLPERIETASGLGLELADLALFDLPLDSLDHFEQEVGAVSAEGVLRVAQRLLAQPLTLAIVGDRARIEAPLRGWYPHEVQVLDSIESLGG